MTLIKRKTLKKAISAVTMFTTVVWLSGIAMFAMPSMVVAAVEDGNLIKSDATNSDGTPTYESLDIYIVKLVGTKQFKRLVLNPTVFESYGHLNYGDVQTVSQSVMDGYTTSGLVRVDTDPDEKVYAMTPDGDIGSKSWVNLSAADFLSLTGSEDGDSIYTINSTDGGNYNTVGDILLVAELEDYYTDGTLPGAVVETGGLSVSLAATTPSSATIPGGATGVEFTDVNLSAGSEGDATITALTVKRTGVGAPGEITKVYLYEGDVRLTSGKTINTSTNEATFNNLNYVVSAGTTSMLSIVADALTGTGNSGNHALGIVSADAVSTTSSVSGAFPVTGNTMSFSGTAAGMIDVESNGSSYTRKVGETEVEVGNFSVYVNGTEDAQFTGVTLYNSGRDILENLKLYRGTELVAEATKSGDYFVLTLTTPYAIAKGESTSFTVKGDIGGRDADTATLYIRYNTDIKVTGNSYGFNLGTDATINTANSYIEEADSTPQSNTTTAQAGQLTIADNGPTATDVSKNTTDIVLLDFSMTPQSNIDITRATITLSGTNFTAADYDDVEIVCGGTIVASQSAVTALGDISFTDTWSLTGGETTECQLRIDVSNTAAGDETIIGALKDITNTANWVIKDSNGDAITDIVPSGDIAGATMTVTSASLTVSLASTPANGSTYVKGSSDVEAVGLVFAAGSSSDVKVNSVKLLAGVMDVATWSWIQTSNVEDVIAQIELYDESGSIASAKSLTVGSSDVSVTFDSLNWTIPAGTNKKLVAKVGISSSAPLSGGNDSIALKINAASDINAEYGSGTNLTATLTNGNATPSVAQIVTTNGTLTATQDADTPNSDLVITGSTNSVTKVKLSAANEAFVVEKLRIKTYYYEGSTVVAADADVAAGVLTANTNLGGIVATWVAGNCVYDNSAGLITAVDIGDIRVNTCGSYLAGSTVATGDTDIADVLVANTNLYGTGVAAWATGDYVYDSSGATPANIDVSDTRVTARYDIDGDEYSEIVLEYTNSSNTTETKTASVTSGVADFSGLDIYVPKDDKAVVTIKAALNTTVGGADNDSRVGLVFDYDSNFRAVGQGSSTVLAAPTTVPATADIAGNTMYAFESIPSVSFASDTPSGDLIPSANTLVAKIDITADAGEDISFINTDGNEITIAFSVSGATVSTPAISVTDGTNVLYSGTLAITATNVATPKICDFGAKDLIISAGTTKTLYVYVDTVTAALTTAGDSIQAWLDDSTATNIDWSIDSDTGNYEHADALFAGDLYGGSLVKP